MQAPLRVFFAVLFAGLYGCTPFEETLGDVCNDPTQNYTADSAYECNQSG